MSERKDRKPWWILSYNKRKYVSQKFKNTEKLIQENKDKGDWTEVKKLKSLLRRAWWGIKRYK